MKLICRWNTSWNVSESCAWEMDFRSACVFVCVCVWKMNARSDRSDSFLSISFPFFPRTYCTFALIQRDHRGAQHEPIEWEYVNFSHCVWFVFFRAHGNFHFSHIISSFRAKSLLFSSSAPITSSVQSPRNGLWTHRPANRPIAVDLMLSPWRGLSSEICINCSIIGSDGFQLKFNTH